MIFIETKEIIVEKFYNEHLKPSVIAKDLNVNPSYVTKIIKKDDRYSSEKAYRQEISKENRKVSKREWIKNKRKTEADKQLDEILKKQHIEASKELSYSYEMSDLAYVKWNRGAFVYDKNSSDLVLNKKLKCGADVPKRVSNVINPNFIKSKKVYV